MSKKVRSLRDRLFEKRRVTKRGCWVWTGGTTKGGYGKVSKRIGVGKKITMTTHRASFELFVGPIPDGAHVLHRCDNPPCFRPKHLFAGNQDANSEDMVLKGRSLRGERNPGGGKLRVADVKSIRRLRARGLSQQAIADRFGVSQVMVSSILRGATWAFV